MRTNQLAVIFLTLNEAHHLGEAIDNVSDIADEVYVLDSLSDDETVSVALGKHATVVQRPFTNFGDQWNFALDRLPIQSRWTLKMDPDERLSPELKEQFRDVFRTPCVDEGYCFPRRLWFMGKPLHLQQDIIRLWKTGSCRFSNVVVNEHPIVNGSVGRLTGTMEHFDSPNLHHWFEKQNRYTTLEAASRFNQDQLSDAPMLFGSKLQQRMWVKKYFPFLPFRYALLFIYNYLFSGVWRSGAVGFHWAKLRSEVYRMIDYKYYEMKAAGQSFGEPAVRSPRQFDHRIIASDLQMAIKDAFVTKDP